MNAVQAEPEPLQSVNRYCRAGMCVKSDKQHEAECTAHPKPAAPATAEDAVSEQDVMFEVFHYAHISEGFDAADGNDRADRRAAIFKQDRKIRAMLLALRSGASK